MTPIACPRCTVPLNPDRRVALIKYKHRDHYWCPVCKKDFSPKYLAACDRCTDLQAVMYSPNYIAIKSRRGTDDAWLIKTLFDKRDRHYSSLHGWMITNLPKYAHLKCVQVARSALEKQKTMILEPA